MQLKNKLFDEVWKSLPIPGEYDAMDEFDQQRWHDVVYLAWCRGVGARWREEFAKLTKDAK